MTLLASLLNPTHVSVNLSCPPHLCWIYPPPILQLFFTLSTSVYNSDHSSVLSSARSFIRRPRVFADPGRVSSVPETNGNTWCSGVSSVPTPWSCSTTLFSRCRWQMLPSSCSGEISLDHNQAQHEICLTSKFSTYYEWLASCCFP